MMKEIIERTKNGNNENLTHKDLTWYLIGRVDDLAGKVVEKSLFWRITGGLFTLLAALAWYVFK